LESEFNDIVHEDNIDREVRRLIEAVEEGDRVRRAVIETLVILGSDAAIEHDV